MTISDQEWASIAELAENVSKRVSGRAGDHFITSKVIKNDPANMLVWIRELPQIAIPIFTFDYNVTYYDESPRDTGLSFGGYKVYTKKAKVSPVCPKVGDIVLVAREMGSDRLPRCLGVLRSSNFADDESEDA